MNYYQARQRKRDGRWDYTYMNDGVIRPLGYCVPWTQLEESLKRYEEQYGRDEKSPLEGLRKFADKHHTDGHATAEEARDCYKRYLVDQRLEVATAVPKESWPSKAHLEACVECGKPTDTYFRVMLFGFPKTKRLCAEHLSDDMFVKYLTVPEQVSSSY